MQKRNSRDLLTFTTPDIDGCTPDLPSIGRRFKHLGNDKVYTMTGFAWNGVTDRWNHQLVGPDGITIVRPFGHLTGNRENGMPRYVEVNY